MRSSMCMSMRLSMSMCGENKGEECIVYKCFCMCMGMHMYVFLHAI